MRETVCISAILLSQYSNKNVLLIMLTQAFLLYKLPDYQILVRWQFYDSLYHVLSCFDSCFIRQTSLESCTRTFFLRTTLKNRMRNSNNPQSPVISVKEGAHPSLPNHHPTEILILGDWQGSPSALTHVQEVHLIKSSQNHFTLKKSGNRTDNFPSL